MQCPTDGALLVTSERDGIEIDDRPTCRGVWLDRDELDKILERSGSQPAAQQAHQPSQQYLSQGYRKPKRKESSLRELFD